MRTKPTRVCISLPLSFSTALLGYWAGVMIFAVNAMTTDPKTEIVPLKIMFFIVL
jgi:hypothetical protein